MGDYLQEEIAAEAAVRNVGAFSRFLSVAALAHGQMINFSQEDAPRRVDGIEILPWSAFLDELWADNIEHAGT